MEVQSEVRERPILFSGPMVRAILEGRKTQTRRVIKPQHEGGVITGVNPNGLPIETWGGGRGFKPNRTEVMTSNPYGKPGDRLWVRETWGLFDTEPKDGPERAHVYYRATDGNLHECRYQLWRPSIYMPRWASRITLEITDIRAERLQEISEEDAIAEGFAATIEAKGRIGRIGVGEDAVSVVTSSAVDKFRSLWEQLNGKRGLCKTCKGHGVVPAWAGSVAGGSLMQDSKDCPDCSGEETGYGWGQNPWVWAISFQRVN